MTKQLTSIAPVSRQYNTGEQPVLVTCSDGCDYICKYTLSSGSAYKLVCELICNRLAQIWGLNTPDFAQVSLLQEHQQSLNISIRSNKLCIGSLFLTDVIDLTKISQLAVDPSEQNLRELITIALFDLWVANEDRNWNNFNLMIDINDNRFIPIDFGCAFNTSTFDYPLSQLTQSDSLMYSDLFVSIAHQHTYLFTETFFSELHSRFIYNVRECQDQIDDIIRTIPQEWQIPQDIISSKLNELFTPQWLEGVWSNFLDIFHSSTEQ